MTPISKKRLLVCSLVVVLIVISAISLMVGPVSLDFIHQPELANFILYTIRMPRLLMAIGAGAALAVSGVVLQSVFRNPLADSTVTGVASGATCGAALSIVVLVPLVTTIPAGYVSAIAAFTGALVTSLAVMRIGNLAHGVNTTTVILAGLVMNSLTAAITGFCTIVGTDAQVRNLSFWLLGGLSGIDTTVATVVLPILVLAVAMFIWKAPVYDVLSFGHIDAQQRGVNVRSVVLLSIVGVSLMVGLVVAWCGMIAFVGIIVPHVLRMLIGARHRWLMLASAVGGAVLVVSADTLIRYAFQPKDIPVGIVTSMLGAPFFLFILMRMRGRMV